MARRMPYSPRRVPPPQLNDIQYSTLPQSPPPTSINHHHHRSSSSTNGEFNGGPNTYQPPNSQYRYSQIHPPPRPPSASGSSNYHQGSSSQDHTAARRESAVATGAVGGAFGPYTYQQQQASNQTQPTSPTLISHRPQSLQPSQKVVPPPISNTIPPPEPPPQGSQSRMLWDAKDVEASDPLHDPDPIMDAMLDSKFDLFSARGWFNVSALIILMTGLITLFAGFPVIHYFTSLKPPNIGYNLGGINGTGQIPDLNLPNLIDKDTPDSAKSRKGSDGNNYVLVFSDEFETAGRTFWTGDDPYWEAVDLHYWPTGDLEWYTPDAITTANGHLVITMTETPNHGNLNWESGMLQSWNKLCFSSGYIEVSVSLPGSSKVPGFWPGVWTMGNLGRAGYGATTEGMWPYSYDECDVGTFPNQTNPASLGGGPAAATLPDGSALSFQPGQKTSACTCKGADHPGPDVSVGRGVPELDVLEAQIQVDVFQGAVSQSYQVAPFNAQYEFNDQSPATTIHETNVTTLNSYKGGQFQQAISAITLVEDTTAYALDGGNFAVYGVEFWGNKKDRGNAYVTWFSEGKETWTITSDSVGPDTETGVGQRLITEEPMSLIINFGMSPGFQLQDYKNLKFPATMLIDYVRVYQRSNEINVGCDPSDHPTTKYIQDHLNAYTNPNLTTWADAGYTFPRNSKYDGC